MNGFLLINKSKGITSFDVVRQVRKALNMRKVGHAGTLDPLAEGLMILALGEGTKLLEYLLKKSKTYEAEITLGKESDTFDAEGKIINISDKEISLEKITIALEKFKGKIKQIPPKYSALKIQGKKAYELARQGIDVQMKAREVEIFENKILDYIYPKLVLKIDCGTGTYIRSIAHDLGTDLECGGYLTALKRIKVGKYLLEDAIDLEDVTAEKILAIEWGIDGLDNLNLTYSESKLLKNGQQITCNQNFVDDQVIACLCDNKLISISKFNASSKKLQPVKNFNHSFS